MGAVRDCWGSTGDAASMSNIHTFFFSFDYWCILSKTALLSSDVHDMRFHLRNEFYFSGVHGAMNRFGVHLLCTRPTAVHSSMNNRKIKLIAYIYIHFSQSLVDKSPRRSHLPANRESTHSVCSNSGTASTFTTSNQIDEIHVFDVKFSGLRHVA